MHLCACQNQLGESLNGENLKTEEPLAYARWSGGPVDVGFRWGGLEALVVNFVKRVMIVGLEIR
jgi:hypothetical protein